MEFGCWNSCEYAKSLDVCDAWSETAKNVAANWVIVANFPRHRGVRLRFAERVDVLSWKWFALWAKRISCTIDLCAAATWERPIEKTCQLCYYSRSTNIIIFRIQQNHSYSMSKTSFKKKNNKLIKICIFYFDFN